MPTEDVIYADKLLETFKYMNDNKMFKTMSVYIEACESGSMFKGTLPTNINVYAITAANEKESSWGTYCDEDDLVKGKSLGTCLGDLFSVNWMEDSDRGDKKETLETQYQKVKKTTE